MCERGRSSHAGGGDQEENSFFLSFFWKKNKMTHKNLKKAKKFFAEKIKRQGKHIFNTLLPIPIYNI